LSLVGTDSTNIYPWHPTSHPGHPSGIFDNPTSQGQRDWEASFPKDRESEEFTNQNEVGACSTNCKFACRDARCNLALLSSPNPLLIFERKRGGGFENGKVEEGTFVGRV